MPTIIFRGNRADLIRSLRLLPAVMSGRSPDALGLARGLQLRLATHTLSLIQQSFLVKSRGGTGSEGVQWAPLAKSTLTKKRMGGTGRADILRDTSRLLRSLNPGYLETPSGEPEQIVRLGLGEVVIGSNCPYIDYHQRGTKTIPARPIFPADGKLPAPWEDDLAETALGGLIRAVELMAASGGLP